LEIETTRFGRIQVDGKKQIEMPSGMLGFPDSRRFVMIRHREDSPFFWYQSVDDPNLAFVLASPFAFKPDYVLDTHKIPEAFSWDAGDENHLECYVVISIPKGSPDKMTANLIGPIVINPLRRQAYQMVLSNSPYSHQTPLLEEK